MEFERVNGAIYIPAKAWNAYQVWRDYNEKETERDIGYAASINLNALRIWLSYEYWIENSEKAWKCFDHLLETANKKGIKILPSLYEACGLDPIQERLVDQKFDTAVCVASPARDIILNEALWERPIEFVKEFMLRYAEDKRLIAIELFNEPDMLGNDERNTNKQRSISLKINAMKFTRTIISLANGMKGRIPLTVGCASLESNGIFMDVGLDIWQCHPNFPKSIEVMQSKLDDAKIIQDIIGKPVWISEWQRVRVTGAGWEGEEIAREELMPNLSTLADTIHKSGMGNFFWSLMLKPAYLAGQRKAGTLNGIFHEDGAVYSLEDARAVSGNPGFEAEERAAWPKWLEK